MTCNLECWLSDVCRASDPCEKVLVPYGGVFVRDGGAREPKETVVDGSPEYWHGIARAVEITKTLPEAYELMESEKVIITQGELF